MPFSTQQRTANSGNRRSAHILLICCLSILLLSLDFGRVQAQSYARSLSTDAPFVGEAVEPPSFSRSGGFYTDEFQLELSTNQEGTSIYYTLDGSEPTAGSLRYEGPIEVENREDEPNVLSMIRTTLPRVKWFAPNDEIFKATIIRARVISGNGEASPIVTQTYFVHRAGANRYHLPVISLVSNAANFFDPKIGIYVIGDDDDNPNYTQSGRDWERPVHIELFAENGARVLAQDAGVRTHGGSTRHLQVKSLRFYARDDYGPEHFNIQLFPDRPFTNYQTFILRNAGNDWEYAHLRDGFIHRLLDHLPLDLQAFRPVVLFLNGEYWGILNMRERQDAEYLETHYGIPTDEVDMLELPDEVSEGSDAHYLAMIEYVETHGATAPEHYEHLQRQMDMENFIDYNIVEIFSANTDWPHNNVENWRYQAEAFDASARYGWDGRWRWFIKDLDFALNGWDRSGHHELDMLSWATSPDGNGHGAWSTLLLRSLLENEAFRRNFINRFADQLNTTFVPQRVLAELDQIVNSLRPEMPEQSFRHGQPSSMNFWENEIRLIRQFVEARPERQRQHLIDFFDLGGMSMVKVNVSSASAGRVRMNSLLIDQQTVGTTDNAYPWQGIYFHNVPVNITAVPHFGYRFVRWEGLDDEQMSGSATLEIVLSRELNLTAHFESDPDVERSYLPRIVQP